MSLEEHFNKIENVFNNAVFVSVEIKKERKSSNIGLIIGKARLIDFSEFHFMEYIEADKKEPIVTYRYHYQAKNKELIFRYDNSPHHKELKSFPHHKHEKDKVTHSSHKSLSNIVEEIIMYMKN